MAQKDSLGGIMYELDSLLQVKNAALAKIQASKDYHLAVWKGDSLVRRKKPDLAEKEYKKAHALQPDEHDPMDKLVEIYTARALNKEHEPVAQRYRLNLPEADPVKAFNKLVNKGDSSVHKHNKAAADIYYQQALAVHGIPCPNRESVYQKLEIPFRCSEQVPPVYTRKADSLLKAGKMQEASTIYHKAIFLYPKDEEIRYKVEFLDSLLSYAPVIHRADSLINAGKFLEGYYTYNKARISSQEDLYRDSVLHSSTIEVSWMASMRDQSSCIEVTCKCPIQDFHIQIVDSKEETVCEESVIIGRKCLNWNFQYYAHTGTYHWIARYKTNCGGRISWHISNGAFVLVKSVR